MPSVGESLRSIVECLAPAHGPPVLVPAPLANQQQVAPTAAPAGRVLEDPPAVAHYRAESIVIQVYNILGHAEFYLPEDGIRINLGADVVQKILDGQRLIECDAISTRSNSILPKRCDY
jgi:hypothetical protein